MPPYKDLADQPEDERIRQIGEKVTREKFTVAVLVDDEPGKPERYIRKLLQRYPGVQILKQVKGPTPGVVTIKVGPRMPTERDEPSVPETTTVEGVNRYDVVKTDGEKKS